MAGTTDTLVEEHAATEQKGNEPVNATTIRLVRDGQGGYATADGRWTVVPVDGMGSGVNNVGGWSNGKRVWRVTDTTGQAVLSKFGDKSSAIRDRLWEVRDLIASHVSREG